VKLYTEKILVVDSDDKLRHLLATRLVNLGYTVFLESTGHDALVTFNKEKPDIAILGLILPKLDGYEVCREIRKKSQLPIILLAALDNISDRITGLDLGADDYVIKPFSPKELEARIRSVLRRADFQNQPKKRQKILNVGKLVIDIQRQQVFKNNLKIHLTAIEFSLLQLLLDNAGKRLSRKIILDNVWGYTPERDVDTRVVDVHISRLRSKIEEDPGNPDLILTVRGKGYLFQKYF